ncbi:hypothetical protein BGZ88_007461 [Linnemannia elongata]|nr:hypothetical protein BGZ88_007461 [Linnemannia elongata]
MTMGEYENKPTLPLELIHAIVWRVPDLPTLHSLLTVNRAVFEMAARRLYFAPLDMVVQANNWIQAFEKLARAIIESSLHTSSSFYSISSLPPTPSFTVAHRDQLQKHFIHVYGIDVPTAQGYQPMLDYFAYMREFAEPPAVLDSIENEIWKDRFLPINFLLPRGWENNYNTPHVELFWTLTKDRLHQLRRIQIPTWKGALERYVDAIPHMTQLCSIAFDMLECPLQEGGELVDVVYDRAVDFVRRFVQYHSPNKHSLRHVNFLVNWSDVSDREQQRLAERAIRDLLSPSHGLVPPLMIQRLNWEECLQNLNRLDLSHVRSISMERGMSWAQLQSRWPDKTLGSILEQCPSLEAFRYSTLIDEEAASLITWLERIQESTFDRLRFHRLANLKVLELACPSHLITDMVHSVFNAFGHSLEVFIMGSVWRRDDNITMSRSNTTVLLQPRVDGLPHLKKLKIGCMYPLELDPCALSHCPVLDILMIGDGGRSYPGSGPLTPEYVRRQEAWNMPLLRVLDLDGAFARKFRPQSLTTMTRLEQLDLTGILPYSPWLPDVVTPEKVPPYVNEEHLPPYAADWTWDWHLPNLKTLNLNGEFAMALDFRFLRFVPALEDMDLKIGAEHPRLLSIESLLPPAEENIANNSNSDTTTTTATTMAATVAPHLHKVRFLGPWVTLDEDTFHRFAIEVIPRLIHLSILKNQRGLTKPGLVRLGLKHPYLRYIRDWSPFTLDDATQLASNLEMEMQRAPAGGNDTDEEEEGEGEGEEEEATIPIVDRRLWWHHRFDYPSLPSKDESAAGSRYGHRDRDSFCIFCFDQESYRFIPRSALL